MQTQPGKLELAGTGETTPSSNGKGQFRRPDLPESEGKVAYT